MKKLTYLERASYEVAYAYGTESYPADSPLFERLSVMLSICKKLYPEQDIKLLEGRWCYSGIDSDIEEHIDELDKDISSAQKILEACVLGRYHSSFETLPRELLLKVCQMISNQPNANREQDYLTVSDILFLDRFQLREISGELEMYATVYDTGFDYESNKGIGSFSQCFVEKHGNRYYLPIFCDGYRYATEEQCRESEEMSR